MKSSADRLLSVSELNEVIERLRTLNRKHTGFLHAMRQPNLDGDYNSRIAAMAAGYLYALLHEGAVNEEEFESLMHYYNAYYYPGIPLGT